MKVGIRLSVLAGLTLLSVGAQQSAWAFGGEDVANGAPWHHLDMTLRALDGDGGDNDQGVRTEIGRNAITNERFRREEPIVVFAGADFGRAAAMDVAWAADYIDSYLYNPIWWLKADGNWQNGRSFERGGPEGRIRAALRTTEDLARLHHDDSSSNASLHDNWERYFYGTLIGLHWAMAMDDVEIARHLLGVSSHAVQDFYAHSNWLDDPARRHLTWQEVPEAERRRMTLYTGAYEQPEGQARLHHGAYSADCTLVDQAWKEPILEPLCSGLSPVQNMPICDTLKTCERGRPVELTVAGVSTAGKVAQDPPGIALDNTWIALLGGQSRGLLDVAGAYTDGTRTRYFDELATIVGGGDADPRLAGQLCVSVLNIGVECMHKEAADPCRLTDEPNRGQCAVDSDDLFGNAKAVATRSTTQWMAQLGASMQATEEGAAFWERVRAPDVRRVNDGMDQRRRLRTRPFEDPNQAAFQFLSAGPYPVAVPGSYASTSHGHYLRVHMLTANAADAGTDADIVARVRTTAGPMSEHVLDMLPRDDKETRTQNPLLVHDDFQAGDAAVYVLGPFSDPPAHLEIFNRAADSTDVAEAAWEDLGASFSAALTGIRRALISPIAGNPDWVGDQVQVHTPEALRSLAGKTTALVVDGGDDGKFRVTLEVEDRTEELDPKSKSQRTTRWLFRVVSLETLREAEMDRLTTSDDPFFFLSFAPITDRASRLEGYWGGPFEDQDTGSVVRLTKNNERKVTIVESGAVAIALRVYESDSENEQDRRELWQTFLTGLDEHTRRESPQLLDTLAAAIGPEWSLGSISAYAFYRGERPMAGEVLAPTSGGWLADDESLAFPLDTSRLKPLPVADVAIEELPYGLVLRPPPEDDSEAKEGR
ncbi:MAG: hypothetical protein AAF184_11640 [Pseudomonadota bacterium]